MRLRSFALGTGHSEDRVDPISMIAESLMLYVLYEVGILLSAFIVRPREPASVADDMTVSSGS